MIGHSTLLSIITLAISFSTLAYALYSFAHVQVNHASLEDLNKLVQEGLVPSLDSEQLVANYKLIHAQIEELAPVVCLRQEFWLRSYYWLVRTARWMHPCARLDREMLYLNAFQAHHYWTAQKRFEAFTNQA